ncbi:uncharacterized protein LOC132732699 [Ruditapes philippinarum]|uniref:uncharacterized protein LOC132732699 n=1 Tax=Ruditapes philippinarum TaxID=129788 RepID=UPI00295A7D4D|nr:uncharacterized protein LOC132732699 [Ruditapes philippinarum]
MPYCRGVSHDPSQLKCFYHNCIDRDVNASYTFVKRVCMTFDELDPVKPYVQTIKIFVNKCGLPKHAIMTETNITSANLCNTTCSECDVTVYDPINEECHHSQCDRPYGLGQGTTLLRKTTNPECLHLEMKTIAGSAPNCEAFEYDEGVLNVEFCLRRCLDLPGCFSVYMDKTAFNCTYHSCTDYVSKNTIDVFSIKNCFTDCPSPTTQTCLNCKQGSLCQTSYYKITTSNSSSCKLLCESETLCKGAVYDSSSMECQLFDCAYATQQYGSIFNRKACNDDCPIYEIYMIEGYVGSCDIIPSMTEYLVYYPELCYERCLETAECRGVTYHPTKLECYYHICDCHLAFTGVPGFKFMWKYCLENVLNRTILLQTNPTLSPRAYPTTPVCKPEPIYIMPCQCSTGAFDNFTTEEIVQQLEQNLTIDARSTSANTRKLTSAEDNRPTSVAVGTIGVILLSSVMAVIIALDIPNIFKLQTPIKSKTKKIKNKKKRTKNFDENVAASNGLHVENVD